MPHCGAFSTHQIQDRASASGHVRSIPYRPITEPNDASDPDHFESLVSSFGRHHKTNSLGIFDILAMLPPSNLCARLKDIYFACFPPLSHVLQDPTFCQRYLQFEQGLESVSLAYGSRICSRVLNSTTIDPKVITELDKVLNHERDLWKSIYLYHSR
ncbi:hypothetical protein E4T52_16841 [Aureobasidium sp. EXF-3400]|nr:hypothetical protein E4T51_05464 [Aureobasidium sp. EXF-12344]KAI4768056.1 hypothetical protein E4T52_16841 [Aureobasidium sp. EXF-3400]